MTENRDKKNICNGHNRWYQRIAPSERYQDGTAPIKQPITPTIEDYVKTIALIQQAQQKVTTNLVSIHMDVSAASVTKVFRRLQQLGLIMYTPYYGVTLTEKGQQLATVVLRRNHLVSLFLIQVLGFALNDVQGDADVLEHVISDMLEQRIAAYLELHDKNEDVQDE